MPPSGFSLCAGDAGMKIGIFGGTFNPPHRGHLSAAHAAVKALELDLLYVIPTGRPPHKDTVQTVPADVRYRLAQLAFAGLANARVSDLEICRAGFSFTIDTILALREQHPNADLYLLLGTDMFLSIETWRRVSDLLAMITPVVFARRQGENDIVQRQMGHIKEIYGVSAVQIAHAALDISSGALREMLPNRQGTDFLGAHVYREIIRRRLYGAQMDFVWLREQVCAWLPPKRVQHVLDTGSTAAHLAAHWGADIDLAREAALLHDITKGLSYCEQLHICEKYDMIPNGVEKIIHAETGAAIARAEFGVCDAVHDAVRYHTVGRENMTLLEQIVYVADYIEPGRDFPGVEDMRRAAYSDLNEAVRMKRELPKDK